VHGSNMFARSNSYLIKLASEKISLMKDMDYGLRREMERKKTHL
jgi:hypothetical protein